MATEEDAAEMASLRRARQFKDHQTKFGDRGTMRAIRDRQDEEQAMKDKEDIRESFSRRIPAEEATTFDGATIVETTEDSAPGGLAAMSLPMQFGSKQKIVDVAAEHAKRERKKLKEKERRQKKAAIKSGGDEAEDEPKAATPSAAPSGSASGPSPDVDMTEEPEPEPDPKDVPLPKDDDDDDDDEDFGPRKPSETFQHAAASDDDIVEKWRLPIANEIELISHSRAVTALALDRSGSRLLTGSYDYTVKFWDFAGMTDALKNFRSIEPEEGHQVRHIQYSVTGDQFLVITGSARPKIYDRDGKEICQFLRGDMYLLDKHKTNGHVTGVTGGCFHPTVKEAILTCSTDGTLRLWDINKVDKRNNNVIKLKAATGQLSPVTACCYSPSGRIIAGAGQDGSLQIWDSKASKFLTPQKVVRNAHEPGTDTSCLVFSKNDFTLLSRGGDGTMKMWDVRNFKEPVKSFDNLPNEYPESDVVFSPDEALICVGTSNRTKMLKGGRETVDDLAGGQLVFIDRYNLNVVKSTKITDKSVVRLLWHPIINQIVAGCSDHTRVLYDPKFSTKGALLCIGKKRRQLDPSDSIEHLNIHLPNALLEEEVSGRLQRHRDRGDAKKTKMPEPPLPGVIGRDGRINNSTTTQFFMKKIITTDKRKLERRDQDPREQLLKYAKQAEDDPMFFGKAYGQTQPKAIYHKLTEEEEKEEQKASEVANVRKS